MIQQDMLHFDLKLVIDTKTYKQINVHVTYSLL